MGPLYWHWTEVSMEVIETVFQSGISALLPSGPHTFNIRIADPKLSAAWSSLFTTVIHIEGTDDSIPPTVICPPDDTVFVDSSCEVLIPDFISLAEAFDNETPENLIQFIQNPAIGTLVNGTGVQHIEIIATDLTGNSDTCTLSLQVRDTIPPNAICKDTTVKLESGFYYLSAEEVDNGSFDNCLIAFVELDTFLFDCTHLGINTVTLSVFDGDFNKDSCQAIITVTEDSADHTFFADTSFCDGDSIEFGELTIVRSDVYDQTFSNSLGCDSIVYLTVTVSPSTIEVIELTTCDSILAGSTVDSFISKDGCDSIVITNTSLLPTDFVTIRNQSCEPLDTGISIQVFTNQLSCDSIVTTITTLLPSDVVTIFEESCNPNDTGTVIQSLTNQFGCDSIVTTITTLLPSDLVTIFEESCNPNDTGTVIQSLTNQFGCDSIVTTITTLLPSDVVTIFEESCNPNDTGTVIQSLTNQFGCDSIVTTITTLLPSDFVTIFCRKLQSK